MHSIITMRYSLTHIPTITLTFPFFIPGQNTIRGIRLEKEDLPVAAHRIATRKGTEDRSANQRGQSCQRILVGERKASLERDIIVWVTDLKNNLK